MERTRIALSAACCVHAHILGGEDLCTSDNLCEDLSGSRWYRHVRHVRLAASSALSSYWTLGQPSGAASRDRQPHGQSQMDTTGTKGNAIIGRGEERLKGVVSARCGCRKCALPPESLSSRSLSSFVVNPDAILFSWPYGVAYRPAARPPAPHDAPRGCPGRVRR